MAADILTAVRLTIFGRVQGVGLRPAIARLAEELELAGEVGNTAQGVALVLEGPRIAVDSFVAELHKHLPPEARLDKVQVDQTAVAQRSGFHIVAGVDDAPIRTEVPRDLNVCPNCLAELSDTGDRRHGYPFTSCTDCGPRYSIIRQLPFERDDTTMQGFGLCPACQAEYSDSKSRRFHAQTIACPQCGPGCWLVDSSGTELARGDAAIGEAAAALCAGTIVALKGLGGYQLLVDATNSEAVMRLRRRKVRPVKPLAVMVSSLAAAESLGQLDALARASLASREGPIVIVPARPGTLAEGVHPDLGCIGLMLPTTPLHQLLAERCPPLIATSGNREGEPLAWEQADAQTNLAVVADCFLHHDRPIYRPVDDSVVRMIAGRSITFRAARGLAPLRLDHFQRCPLQILAVGGQQKVAIALHNGCQAILGPHIGDLDELLTRQRFVSHVKEFCELYRATPEFVVHDLHPDYFTTRWAEETGLPTLAVQHHHAHVVSAMVEHGWLDREVLGMAWDGTGYGPDGTIWGGEFLRSTAAGYRRVARLRPFPLFGGEAAIREPWRARWLPRMHARKTRSSSWSNGVFIGKSSPNSSPSPKRRGALLGRAAPAGCSTQSRRGCCLEQPTHEAGRSEKDTWPCCWKRYARTLKTATPASFHRTITCRSWRASLTNSIGDRSLPRWLPTFAAVTRQRFWPRVFTKHLQRQLFASRQFTRTYPLS
jgi:hydrogenase maturation protein HypF